MENDFCRKEKNKITNFLFSLIIYFIIASLFTGIVSYCMFKDFNHGYIPLRGIVAIYLTATRRIKFFKENN